MTKLKVIRKMNSNRKLALIASAFIILGASFVPTGPTNAGSYDFTYHSDPNKSHKNCRWVYKWKWVYGKKVRVKLRVCN